MITLLLLASLNCPDTKMHDRSGLGWKQEDYNMLEQAKQRCAEIYEKAPCVSDFFKLHKQDYYVSCGPEKGTQV